MKTFSLNDKCWYGLCGVSDGVVYGLCGACVADSEGGGKTAENDSWLQ